jgi:hypothetical protein
VLNKEGYIDKKVENASNQQEDTHSRFSLLCKTANITGKFPKVFEFYETKLPVKWLKLKEALNYMSLSMAVVAPLLISPMTTRSIEDATGYKNSSIWNVFSALRYLHLLDRSGNYYSLTSRPDRRQNVLYALRRCARKRVECADVLKTVASSCDANGWTFIGFRPSLEEMSVRINNQYGKRGLKLRKQILDLFLSEGLIVYADYEKLSSISK